jgi:hypothetical protein
MNAKFNPGDEALYKGSVVTIEVSVKDFSNNKISYQLLNGPRVNEEELKEIGNSGKETKSINPELKDLQELYSKLYGKEAPANKKKDVVWLAAKIDEQQGKATPVENPYDVLVALDYESLQDLVTEKKLEIELEDYSTKEELLTAICQELDVQIPE